MGWYLSHCVGKGLLVLLLVIADLQPNLCFVEYLRGQSLAPLLFSIYMLQLGHIIRRLNINKKIYMDDI